MDIHCVRIVVTASSALEDAVVNFLMERGCSGTRVEEVEGGIRVEGYYPDVRAEPVCDALRRYIASLREMGIWEGSEEIKVEAIPEVSWGNAWKEHFRATPVGRRLVVHPPWEAPHPGRIPILIEPGMAFGTGDHPTTRLCLEELEDLMAPGMRVLDIGTGTGILAIAAVKLGAREAVALDIDPEAVKSAREHVVRNGVRDRVQVFHGSLDDGVCGPFDLAVANLYREVLLSLLLPLKGILLPKAPAVFSGLLREDLPVFSDALARAGYDVVREEVREGWAAVVAKA